MFERDSDGADTTADVNDGTAMHPPDATDALLQTLRALPVHAVDARRSVAEATTAIDLPSAHMPFTAAVVEEGERDGKGDENDDDAMSGALPFITPQERGHGRKPQKQQQLAVPHRILAAARRVLQRLRRTGGGQAAGRHE